MSWILYGVTGYTGRLVAGEAVRRGLQPILAGRNAAAVRSIAEELSLDWKTFNLLNPQEIRDAIRGSRLVLHCAGPFSETGGPMIEGCLAEGVHYLDITGEISVFDYAHARTESARRADVVLIPGVGFDVVPTDCLAARLVEALPAATELKLAFEMGGGLSPGTAKTAIESFHGGGLVRRGGKLKTVPVAWKSREIPFAHAQRTAVTIPWGDVFTAFISTGIPDIEVYMSMPPSAIAWLRRTRWLQPLLAPHAVQSFLKRRVESRIRGPSDEARKASSGELWGRVKSADGRRVSATMTTPNGYDVTVSASLGIVEHLLQAVVEGGYYTPSLLMGSGYAESLPGVTFKRID
jgi:short subunit dehydrogenase-like uncharacterized protein